MFGIGKQTELLEAAWSANEPRVTQLLHKRIALVNSGASKRISRSHADFSEGDTALHLAARQGHRRIVKLLLSLKAFVNVPNALGAMPLHYATISGHKAVVVTLLEHGAELEVQDTQRRTVLHEAALGGHEDLVKFFIAKKMRVNAKDQQGNTPLHDAASIGSKPSAEALVAAGAELNDRNTHDRTPLHLVIVGADRSASEHAMTQSQSRRDTTAHLVTWLLRKGADANATDSLGETPLDLLHYLEGNVEANPLVDLLRSNGGQWKRYANRHQASSAPMTTSDETLVGVHAPSRRNPSHKHTTEGPATTLGNQPLLIGRDSGCTIRLHSLTLSRKHAQIELQQDEYFITDLGSHNGTQVNGDRIEGPRRLSPGDSIKLGIYEFSFDGTHLTTVKGELSEEELKDERFRRRRVLQ